MLSGYHHAPDEDGGRCQGHRHGQQLQPVHQGGSASLELNIIAFELNFSSGMSRFLAVCVL